MISPGIATEFDAIFNNSAIGILVVDREGDIVLANDFALRQFEYNAEGLIGQKVEVIIPQRFRKRHVQHRSHYHGSAAHSRPMGLGMDLFGCKSTGEEFPVEVSLSPYRKDEEEFYIAFVSDISVRKRSEAELLRLNAELEQKVNERTKDLFEALTTEKELSELKSRFVSMASHEFKTPLSTILSSSYLLSQYTTTNEQPKRDKHLQRIINSGNMLNDILNDFLSVGKIEEGRVQPRPVHFDVQEQLGMVTADMQGLLQEGQRIEYRHEGGTIMWLDLSMFRHIVMNLISNAIKFSAPGSLVSVSTRCANGQLVLSVKDSGIGISRADQEHLFERFFRGENVAHIQGTGLGLHIVAKYTEMLGGSLTYASELGSGTAFTVTFNNWGGE